MWNRDDRREIARLAAEMEDLATAERVGAAHMTDDDALALLVAAALLAGAVAARVGLIAWPPPNPWTGQPQR